MSPFTWFPVTRLGVYGFTNALSDLFSFGFQPPLKQDWETKVEAQKGLEQFLKATEAEVFQSNPDFEKAILAPTVQAFETLPVRLSWSLTLVSSLDGQEEPKRKAVREKEVRKSVKKILDSSKLFEEVDEKISPYDLALDLEVNEKEEDHIPLAALIFPLVVNAGNEFSVQIKAALKDREGKVILTHESSARSYESNLLFLMGVIRQGEKARESKGMDTYIKAMNDLLAFIERKKNKLVRKASVAA